MATANPMLSRGIIMFTLNRMRCRAPLHKARRVQQNLTRSFSQKAPIDLSTLLAKPTWSVRSLLPDSSTPPSHEITPEKLHHLLRLSALPLPTSPEEEASMLSTLHSQLHFVKDIQKVNTEGVKPLQSIRDETEEGIEAVTIGMEQLRGAFGKEEISGRNRRPRRKRGEIVDGKGVEDWNVLGTASETAEGPGGKFFVVRSGKGDP